MRRAGKLSVRRAGKLSVRWSGKLSVRRAGRRSGMLSGRFEPGRHGPQWPVRWGRRSGRPRRFNGSEGSAGSMPGSCRPAGWRRCRRGADQAVLVVHRHERVDRIAGRHDVADPVVGGNPGERCVRLDEAPVSLRGQLGVDVLGWHVRSVQPRRQPPQWSRQVRRLENQQRADHLHPGRPGLARGADHNVAGPEAEAQPPAAVLAGRLPAHRGSGHAVSVAKAGRHRRPRAEKRYE